MSAFLLRRVRVVDVEAGSAPAAGPVDVLVSDGVVAAVGAGLRPASPVPAYDADGGWLIPGLWDAHVHLGQWAATASRLDLAGVGSVPQALERVGERLAADPDAPLVWGWGHRCALWPEPPTVAALDAVAGARAVVLVSGDGHHAWCSSAALAALGLAPRDGLVEESEWFAAYPRLSALAGRSPRSGDHRRAQAAAAARGVVGLVDLEFDERPETWVARSAAGGVLLRVRVGAYAATLEDYLALGVGTGRPLPGCDPRVTMGPLKIISDGSLNTRTAWCHEPYADRPGRGAPNLGADELRALMTRATAHGLEVATHAIGDAAVAAALDAYAATGARGSIEHAQLVARSDVRRLAGLGLRASVQPAHLLDDRDLTEVCWPDRAERCFMFRSLLDAGVPLVLGSDAPVSPLDPWLAMAAAVHRSEDEREPWHPEQAITVREALAASVDGHHTVRPGMPADLALLGADPLAPGRPAEQAAGLRAMPVLATWVGGVTVHGEAVGTPG